MSTLGTLKAEIADDIARSDLTTQIASAISSAIDHYKSRRFYFNETRSVTFNTVAGQSTYDVGDNVNIPLFAKLDDVFLTDTGGTVSCLDREQEPASMEELLDSSAASGEPYLYGYYEESFRFYPIPDAAYTIRPVGVIEKAAPVNDAETDNVWMTKAYELIRCRAKVYLYGHVIRDAEEAATAGAAEQAALSALRDRGASKIGSGQIVRTYF